MDWLSYCDIGGWSSSHLHSFLHRSRVRIIRQGRFHRLQKFDDNWGRPYFLPSRAALSLGRVQHSYSHHHRQQYIQGQFQPADQQAGYLVRQPVQRQIGRQVQPRIHILIQDYEEIYIACHSIFGIYKNLVILIATIEFISTNRSKLIAIFIVLAAMYYSIFILFRKVTRKILKHYYDYKYNFVRCLQESIQGS